MGSDGFEGWDQVVTTLGLAQCVWQCCAESECICVKRDCLTSLLLGILPTLIFFQKHVQFATFSLLTLLQLRSIKKSVQFFHCVAHPKLPYFIGPDVTCRYTCYAPVSERNADKVKVKKVKAKKVAASKMTRTTDKWCTCLLDSFDWSCITIEYRRQDSACAGHKEGRCALGQEPKGRNGQAKAGREFKGETHGFLQFDLAQIPSSLSVAPRRHFFSLPVSVDQTRRFNSQTQPPRNGRSSQLIRMAMHRVQSSDKTQKGHELWGAIGCAWDLLDFTISQSW